MKKVLFFLYVLLIAILTFIMVPVFSSLGASHFLQENEELLTSSNLDLVSGTVLAFKNNKSFVYVKKEPLFKESYIQEQGGAVKYRFDLSFYEVISKRGRKYEESLVVIIENVYVDELLLSMTTENEYLIYFYIEFSDEIVVNDKTIKTAKNLFEPLYDGRSGILLFDMKHFRNDNKLVDFNKINIAIPRTTNTEINLLTLSNDLYGGQLEEDVFENGNKNINSLKRYNKSFSDSVDLDTLDSNLDFYYSESLLKLFRSKYNYFLYFVISWIFIVLSLTYFLFLNKYVKLLMKAKKEKKAYDFENLKEKIKMEDLK